MVVYGPGFIQRVKVARRSFYMNQLLKKKFIETSLGMERGGRKMKLSELKKKLKENEQI
jgi:hypothetical protein